MRPSSEIAGPIIVLDKGHLRNILRQTERIHYTYLLRRPDGVECFGGTGTPFYCGIGRGMRIFTHLEDVQKGIRGGRKSDAIRSILESGDAVLHCIDSFHDREPWGREEELIRSIGQLKHGTGPLTNEQDYAPSHKLNGIELRKYAADHLENPDVVPATFRLGTCRLAAGPIEPRSRDSVFGKIYTALEANLGVTGNELVALLMRIDFSGNKSAYTQSGEVCAAWICDYIEGGFYRKDRLHIQLYAGSDDDE